MEWVASTLHTTSEHGASSITTADARSLAASSRLNSVCVCVCVFFYISLLMYSMFHYK